MHHPLSRLRRGHGSDERGAVAVMMAISLVALLISSAMVLDFGLVRVDRQVDKSAADSAVTGGLYSLIGGDGKPHPYAGICGAINYLKNGVNRFSGLSAGAGTFKNGSGTVQAGFACATGDALLNQPCTPGSTATWASFHWTGSYQGAALNIDIHSGYNLATSGFVEETLPAVQSDNADTAQGCDQVAVIIRRTASPAWAAWPARRTWSAPSARGRPAAPTATHRRCCC